MTALSDFQGAWNNLLSNFWIGDQNGHIRTQRQGYTSLSKAQGALAPASVQQDVAGWNGGIPDCWCQAQFVNTLYWHHKLTGADDLWYRMEGNLNWLLTQFSQAQLQDASPQSLVVHASDDAAWLALSMLEVYDATQDQRAYDIAVGLLNSTYAYYTPSSGAQNGLLYALPNNNSGHVNVSSLYEIGIALACLRVYNISVARGAPDTSWLNKARTSCHWMQTLARQSSTGLYYAEIHLNSLQPVVQNGPAPQKGASDFFLGGAIGMAALHGGLYLATNVSAYLTNMNAAITGIVRNYQEYDAELAHNVFLNDRDPWTETFFLPEFLYVALPMASTPANTRTLIRNSAASVIAHCKTPDNCYTADWVPGTFWSTHGQSGIGQATAQQIMTSATTINILLANAILG